MREVIGMEGKEKMQFVKDLFQDEEIAQRFKEEVPLKKNKKSKALQFVLIKDLNKMLVSSSRAPIYGLIEVKNDMLMEILERTETVFLDDDGTWWKGYLRITAILRLIGCIYKIDIGRLAAISYGKEIEFEKVVHHDIDPVINTVDTIRVVTIAENNRLGRNDKTYEEILEYIRVNELDLDYNRFNKLQENLEILTNHYSRNRVIEVASLRSLLEMF